MPRKLDDVRKTRMFPHADSAGLPTPLPDALPVPVGTMVPTRGSREPAAEPEPAEESLECPGYGHGV